MDMVLPDYPVSGPKSVSSTSLCTIYYIVHNTKYRVTKKNVTRLDFNKKLEVSISKEIAVFVLLFFSNFLYTDLQWISDVKY